MIKSSTIAILCLLILATSATFTPIYEVVSTSNGTNFLYSSNLNYLAISADTQLYLLNGHTSVLWQQFDLSALGSISALAFNQDSTVLAVGFNHGLVNLFDYSEAEGKFVNNNRTYRSSLESTVESMCFTSTGSALIVGAKQNQVTVWVLESDSHYISAFGDQFVFSVACSPTENNIFAVGGGSNNNAKLTFFQFTGNNTSILHQTAQLNPYAITSLSYPKTGLSLYFAYKTNQINKIDTKQYHITTIYIISKSQLSGLRVSADESFVMVLDGEVLNVVEKGKEVWELTQSIQLTVEGYGFVDRAGRLFAVTAFNKAKVYGLCPPGQYYVEEDASCHNCQDGCICDLVPDVCYFCPDKFFLRDTTCMRCTAGCRKCDSETSCNQCEINFELKDGFCVCKPGFFQREEQCVACGPGCLECSDDTHCNTCKPEFELREGLCICPSGTYLDSDTCLPCSRGCLSCIDSTLCYICDLASHYILSQTHCICDSSSHFIDDGQNCICAENYYLRDNICLRCPAGCKSCTSESSCSQCYEGLEIRDGLCRCKNGDQYLGPDDTCHRCQDTLPFCVSCDGPDVCKGCQEGTNRVVKDGKCECKEGYFPDADNVCQPCEIAGCLQCLDLNSCKTCDASNFWQHDQLTHRCKCIHNYTQYDKTCIPCAIGCIRCDPSECLDCDQYNHWVSNDVGQCECQRAYYQDGEVCRGCMLGCLECQRGEFCDSCDREKHFQARSGICVCESGYFVDNATCSSCASIPHCIQCLDSNTCTLCNQNFTLNTTSHKCYCPAGKYIDKDNCLQCPVGCLTCTSSTNCTSCEKGSVLKNGQCVKENHVKQMVFIIVGVMALAALGMFLGIFSFWAVEMRARVRVREWVICEGINLLYLFIDSRRLSLSAIFQNFLQTVKS